MALVLEACGEVDSVRGAAAGGAAVHHRRAGCEEIPEGKIGQRCRGGVDELAAVRIVRWVVDVNDAVAEVADEEVAGKDAEVRGCEGDAPRCIQIPAGDCAGDEVALGVEDVDDTATRTEKGNVRRRAGAERVSNPYLVVEDVNGIWRVAGREVGIGEGAR